MKEPSINDDEIARKRKDKGKEIDLDAGKKKKQRSRGDSEGFMKSARDSYVRQQRSPSRLNTPPPHSITDEDIEADRLARAALEAIGLPPSRQTEGTSGTRHSPSPKTTSIPPTDTPKRMKSMAKKKSRPIGNPVPPPIKEPLDPELVKNVGIEAAQLLRWMKGQIEASKSREDDRDCELEDLKNTIKILNFQLDNQISLNHKIQANMDDMSKALMTLKRGSRSMTLEVNRLRERLNEDPLICDEIFDSSIFKDAVIFYLDQDEKEEKKHEDPTDPEPSKEIPKNKNNEDDEGHGGTSLGTGGTSSNTHVTHTGGEEGNMEGNETSDIPVSEEAKEDVVNEDMEDMPEEFMEEGKGEKICY
ncbi:hypothetical protein L1987_09180 [Smallanthus sonchifolius]|uniref:Uncharacterized protein n=1 Tax=Smallanthus sonchifolius TaxID=185202 RepID=A0ACB9JP86_9ASTR|nr:hypothetical protein L1987_09180 [Smallanthus sonchifolius]